MAPNPFWVAVIVIVVAFLFVWLAQLAAPTQVVTAPAPWYSIQGQQDYTDVRASDVVFADPYNPDLAFFPSENSSCSTQMKNWGNNELHRNMMV